MISATNPRIRLVRGLVSRRKDRWSEGAFVVQGQVLLSEALEAGWTPRFVLVRADDGSSAHDQLLDMDGIELFKVEPAVFDSVNDTVTPHGVLGVFDMPRTPEPRCADSDWYLVVDHVQDPGNLGTMIRSAEAAGASGVLVTSGSVDPFSPKVVRASAGALFHVPVHFVDGLDDPRLAGMSLIGTTSHDDDHRVVSLWDVEPHGCIGLVFGNEPRGVSADASLLTWIRVPHAGRTESLNVAMAASVVAMVVGHHRGTDAASGRAIQPLQGGPSD